MVIIDIESNTSLGGLTLDPAGMHCLDGTMLLFLVGMLFFFAEFDEILI